MTREDCLEHARVWEQVAAEWEKSAGGDHVALAMYGNAVKAAEFYRKLAEEK